MSTAHHQVIPPAPSKIVEVHAVMYFDGTLNNRSNTRERELAEGGLPSYAYVHYGAGDTSYANDYTNVELLYRHTDDGQRPDGKIPLKIYVEGIGTANLKEDSTLGYAFGAGDTGIVAKVQLGLSRLISNIIAVFKGQGGNLLLRIDVIGFSRGAAAARHFIHAALHYQNADALNPKSSEPLRQRLIRNKIQVTQLTFGLAGLFDTVASFNLNGTAAETSSTSILHLDAIKYADNVFHLVAADEHRLNFALTDISSARTNGKEFYLPGVHCDIGGSYVDYTPEHFSILDVGPAPVTSWVLQYLKADLDRWILDGWFEWRDVQHRSFPGGMQVSDSIRNAIHSDHKIKVTRAGNDQRGLRNKYSLLALHLMRHEAEKYGIVFKSSIHNQAKTSLTISCPQIIQEAFQKFLSDFLDGKRAPLLPEDILKVLRRNYFHFSANYDRSFDAFAPRFIGSQRVRKVHQG